MTENSDASSKILKSESKKNKLRRRRNVVEKSQSESKTFEAIDVGIKLIGLRDKAAHNHTSKGTVKQQKQEYDKFTHYDRHMTVRRPIVYTVCVALTSQDPSHILDYLTYMSGNENGWEWE